ncbi:Ig-like domain-containing protein, partial [Comamonas sp.]|uniref:Ig-like domain-containing protein n=1 Tax=Comamonas sp. TaxID=34028 RepID=UPI0033906B3F
MERSMTRLPHLRALFCLALAWLCAGTVTPALAQSTPTSIIAIDNVLPITGAFPNGGFTNDSHPIFNGFADISSTVTIYNGSVPLMTVQASVLGTWIYSPSVRLTDGVHSFTFTSTIGNRTSPPSQPFIFTVDTIPPQPPVITDIMLSGNVGANTSFTLTGTAEANSTVNIYDHGVLTSSVIASSNGLWSFASSLLPPGMRLFTATASDAAGNVSTPSAERAVNPLSIDTLALPNSGGAAQVTITSNTSSCTLGTPPAFGQADLTGAPAKAKAPLGALTFTATSCAGATLTVRIAYPVGSLATLTPHKFGPPSTGAASTWFAHGSVSGDTVTYTVTDNGIGDSNLTPGVIADPFA